MFKLHYYVSNGGDGSATVHFMPTLDEAKQEDEEQPEGWGESSAGTVNLKVEDGKLYFEKAIWDPGYKRVWVEVQQ